MFAARFDPTKALVEDDHQRGVPNQKFSINVKRSREDDSEEDEDEDEDEDEEEDEDIQEDEDIEENEDEENDGRRREDREEDSKDEHKISDNHETEDVDVTMADTRHSSVLSRFQKTISLQNRLSSSDIVTADKTEEEDVEMHDLAPIPQPALVRDPKLSTQASAAEYKSTAWLNTTKIHYDNSMVKPFTSYEDQLDRKLRSNIANSFSSETFPIQTIILDTFLPKLNFSQSVSKKQFTRRVGDVLVNASTGSGKTLAYSIPVVQALSKRTVNKLRALVLVPTKLLIHQVYETICALSKGTSLIIGISKLENSLREEHSKLQHQEPDILIITPGRLVDHLQLETFTLKNLKFLILDEADRLLNQSFQNWCSELMSSLKKHKLDQKPGSVIKMVFSATLTANTEKLHNLQLHNPKLYVMDSVKLYTLPNKLQEFNIHVPTAKSFAKPLFLLRLLSSLEGDNNKVLVFVKSNEASIRLATLVSIMLEKQLGDSSINVASINSNNSKGINKKLINDFATADGNKKVLISTDLMSRGIDINNITHVVNYDLPISSQQYVHRCGRTARAQTSGIAFNILVGKGERKFWKDQVDVDLSRDVDGCQVRLYGETSSRVQSSENQEDHEGQEEQDEKETIELLQLDSTIESTYRNCLHELQRGVLQK